jgi:hypothetical protein
MQICRKELFAQLHFYGNVIGSSRKTVFSGHLAVLLPRELAGQSCSQTRMSRSGSAAVKENKDLDREYVPTNASECGRGTPTARRRREGE